VYRKKFAKEIERLPEVFAKPLVKEGSRMALLDPSSAPTKVDPNAAPRLQPFARDDKYLKAAFKEIAKLYGGEDNALKIVEASPGVLNMNSAGFAATKAAFVAALTEDKVDDKSGKVTAAKFNEDDVVGMVVRNPNLINIRPSGYGGADTSDESTVQMSYVVAATRPAGPVLLGALAVALLTPFAKQLAGLD